MANYHPDKVAHLGAELQELAKRNAQAINRAYQELMNSTSVGSG
jgi:DnaJ-domain-containing protein 1